MNGIVYMKDNGKMVKHWEVSKKLIESYWLIMYRKDPFNYVNGHLCINYNLLYVFIGHVTKCLIFG